MRTVATLTTRPGYHDGLRKNLDSLVEQFDAVYLGLPSKSLKGVEYEPFYHPGVTVVKLEEDIGPASKLLGAMIMEERKNDTLIVSVDDDYIYRKDLRDIFESARENDLKDNKHRVMTFSGVYMKYWNFGTWGLNGGWHDKEYFYDWNGEKKLTTIAGYCGCAYPANLLGNTEEYVRFVKENSKKHERLIYNDDVLISAYLATKNIERVRISLPEQKIGELCKGDKEEVLSPNPRELYDTIYSLREYFEKNNPKKYTLVWLDVFILVSIIIIIFTSFYILSRR